METPNNFIIIQYQRFDYYTAIIRILMNAMVKLEKLPWKFILKYDSKLVNILFWFDNDFEIKSKYHRITVVLLL